MFTRRGVVLSSLAAAAAGPAPAQPAARRRLAWPAFRASSDYRPWRQAIARMRANPDRADPGSWLFWGDVHERHCPHHRAWFLTWHRGLLHLFETKLAELSGVPDLHLPYWDYYSDPALPAEFTSGGPGDPLWSERVGRSVAAALTLEPFGPAHVNFEEGRPGSFELALEFQPHNPVHNLIGGVMVTMQSPQDPIFWLHHANVDRLFTAWTAAGGGRALPPPSSAYWAGDFDYAPGLSLPRALMRDGHAAFGDLYDDISLPAALPLVGAAPPPPPPAKPSPRPGAARAAGAAAPRTLAPGAPLSLGGETVSVRAAVAAPPRPRRATRPAPGAAGAAPSPPPPPPAAGATPGVARPRLSVILDGVDLTALGRRGGYFYKVLLEGRPLGTVGAFEIAAARQPMAGMAGMGAMPARLEFPADPALHDLAGLDPQALTVTFQRIDGAADRGESITVRRFSVQAAD